MASQYTRSISNLIKSTLAHFDEHFHPYPHCCKRQTRSVEEVAKRYLHRLFQCDKRNMKKMTEKVSGSCSQGLQHMLSGRFAQAKKGTSSPST